MRPNQIKISRFGLLVMTRDRFKWHQSGTVSTSVGIRSIPSNDAFRRSFYKQNISITLQRVLHVVFEWQWQPQNLIKNSKKNLEANKKKLCFQLISILFVKAAEHNEKKTRYK